MGSFEIADGKITDTNFTDAIKTNQYFRIVGSVFNDGVYQYTDNLTLTDEVFVGSIWLMAIPKEVLDLSEEIAAWINKYGGVDSAAMSPFSSESFGGYSYTKAQGSTSAGGGTSSTWQTTFAARLNQWRKL